MDSSFGLIFFMIQYDFFLAIRIGVNHLAHMRAKQNAKPKKEKAVPAIPAAVLSSAPNEPPPPHILMEQALDEPNFFDLRPYLGVIATLRSKGFSYRDITKWLIDRGLDTNYSEVYRTYQRSLSPMEAEAEEARTLEEEQQEERHGY